MLIPLWVIVLVVVAVLLRVRGEFTGLIWQIVGAALLGALVLFFVYGLESVQLIRQESAALFDAYPIIPALLTGWMVFAVAWVIYDIVRARRN